MKLNRLLNACDPGSNWVDEIGSFEEAWNVCERGDWMLWICKKRDIDLKKLTLAKVKCARLVEHLMTDDRSKHALDIAERFANGNATREELDAAAAAAYAAAAYAAAADAAAYAAAYAAYAACAAYAAYAACAAYAVYAAADATAKRKEILLQCANIIRDIVSYNELNMEEFEDV